MRNRKRHCALKNRNTGTTAIIQLTFLRPVQLADRQQNTDVRLKLNVQNIKSENKGYQLQNAQKEGKWNYKCRHWKKNQWGKRDSERPRKRWIEDKVLRTGRYASSE